MKTKAVQITVLIEPMWAEDYADVIGETFRNHPEVMGWAWINEPKTVEIDDTYVEGDFVDPNTLSYIGRQ